MNGGPMGVIATSAGPHCDRQSAAWNAAGVRLDRDCHDPERHGWREQNAVSEEAPEFEESFLGLFAGESAFPTHHEVARMPVAIEQD
jgi:hypothetical protein